MNLKQGRPRCPRHGRHLAKGSCVPQEPVEQPAIIRREARALAGHPHPHARRAVASRGGLLTCDLLVPLTTMLSDAALLRAAGLAVQVSPESRFGPESGDRYCYRTRPEGHPQGRLRNGVHPTLSRTCRFSTDAYPVAGSMEG